MSKTLFSIFITLILPSISYADIFDWQTNNIQLYRGNGYKLGADERSIVTLEHADGWRYGDNFAFIDWEFPENGKSSYYFEISPRLSLSKLLGKNLSYGIIKDVLISTTFEKPEGFGPQYLYGGAVDFNIPGFNFVQANAYIHDDTQQEGHTWQVTLVWNFPLTLWGADFFINGFADLQGHEGSSQANQLVTSYFHADIGSMLGVKKSRLLAGIEWQYWHNKFGVDGVTESVPQAQLMWIF